MYSYASKAYIVCHWKEERGRRPIAKWGKAICKNKLVSFFDDPAHQRCSCGSVYYKQGLFIINGFF